MEFRVLGTSISQISAESFFYTVYNVVLTIYAENNCNSSSGKLDQTEVLDDFVYTRALPSFKHQIGPKKTEVKISTSRFSCDC